MHCKLKDGTAVYIHSFEYASAYDENTTFVQYAFDKAMIIDMKYEDFSKEWHRMH